MINLISMTAPEVDEDNHRSVFLAKSWKSHISEFVMLFLAVTLGFFVENRREHYNERQQEQEYINSISDDIRVDLKEIDISIDRLTVMTHNLDTIVLELTSPKIYSNSNRAYSLWTKTIGYRSFTRNDRTISQLKNNGGLRLIQDKKISDLIMTYDQTVRAVYSQQDLMDRAILDVSVYSKLFDFTTFSKNAGNSPVPLPKSDPQLLSAAVAHQNLWKVATSILIQRLTTSKEKGQEVLSYIEQQNN